MKKVFKILGAVLLSILVLLCIAVLFVNSSFPKVDKAPEMNIQPTPELVERGNYLANHVAACMDCHAKRDFSRFSGPPVAGTLGQGGDRFDQTIGIPGVFYAKNITPYGISRYTDGELFRVITTGVTKEGDALFPIMPYPYYGQMDEQDVISIIAYLRTLPSIESDIPSSEPDFPFSIILKTIPKNATLQKRPDHKELIAYGKYMANMAGCVECHTPVSQGQIIPDLAFSGGREFPMPGGIVRSANLTPDDSGLGTWSEKAFVNRFKSTGLDQHELAVGEVNSIMPWTMYAGMDTTDIRAIYAYLRQVKPIENTVVKYSQSGEEK